MSLGAVNPTLVPAPQAEHVAAKRQADPATRAAAMLEGVFLRELMKAMRETVPESSLFGESMGGGIYNEMFDQAIADEVTRGDGVGLRQVLLEQLGGAASSLRASPRHAASVLRQVSQMTGPGAAPSVRPAATPPSPAAAAAASPMSAATAGSASLPGLGGVEFEDPRRPEPVRLSDADGRLLSPVRGAAANESWGISYAAPGEEVRAAGSGQVLVADQRGLIIDHGNGVLTRYFGMGRLEAQPGDLVVRGQSLGQVGASSLQFQTIQGGRAAPGAELSASLLAEASPPSS